MFTKKLIEIIACPKCKNEILTFQFYESKGEEILSGEILCAKCERKFTIKNGIPNFLFFECEDRIRRKWCQTLRREKNLFKKLANQNIWSNKWHEKSLKLKGQFANFCDFKGNILDVGCGNGDFATVSTIKLTEYYGIDPIVLECQYHFPFLRATGEFLPFKRNSFDNIICISTLDHLISPTKFFEEARRVLKKNGQICILNTIEIKNIINKLYFYGKDAIIKIYQRDFRGIKRGIELVILGRQDPHHMHHFIVKQLEDYFKVYFPNFIYKLVDRIIFIKGTR